MFMFSKMFFFLHRGFAFFKKLTVTESNGKETQKSSPIPILIPQSLRKPLAAYMKHFFFFFLKIIVGHKVLSKLSLEH